MVRQKSIQEKREQKRKQRQKGRAHSPSGGRAVEFFDISARRVDAIRDGHPAAATVSASSSRLAPLSYIHPSKVVRDRSDKVGLFFLMLSVIFNDIKDLAELTLSVQSCSASSSGMERIELRGRHAMLHRFITGVLHELMILISKQRDVLLEKEFKAIASQLDPSAREFWDSITSIAQASNKAEPDTATKGLLAFIRNNVSFHYHAMESMANGWKSLSDSAPQQEAPYSMGVNAPGTRFYYADAVLIKIMDNGTKKFSATPDAPGFDKQVLAIMYKANVALASLLHAFLDSRATALPTEDE
jgi:hypothetical protein